MEGVVPLEQGVYVAYFLVQSPSECSQHKHSDGLTEMRGKEIWIMDERREEGRGRERKGEGRE